MGIIEFLKTITAILIIAGRLFHYKILFFVGTMFY